MLQFKPARVRAGTRTLLAAGAAILLAGSSSYAQEPKRGGVLSFGINAGDPPTFDCHASALFNVIHTMSTHYSTLLRVDVANYPKLVGDLAESWSPNADHSAYTFKLRPNVKFHDGSPMTSEDVMVSFERIRNPPPGIASVRKAHFSEVKEITAPDPNTVVFHLKRSMPSFPYIVSNPLNCVFSAAKLKQDPRFPERNVLGTGPFMFSAHSAGAFWEGKKFDGYFKPGLPLLDGYRAQLVTGPALVNAIQGGQIVGEFRGLAPADRDRLVQAHPDRYNVHEMSWGSNNLVTFNTQKPPFDDARVRRALSLAIDRWQGSTALQRSSNLKAVGGVIRPGAFWAANAEELEAMPGFSKDIAKSRAEAKRLLAEAGHAGLKFKLSNRAAPANPWQSAAIFILDQWRQIGVEVEHVPLQDSAFNTVLAQGTFDVSLDFQSDFVDEPDFILSRYQSADISNHRSRYIDRTLDEWFNKQSLATSPDERRKIVRDFDIRLATEAYSVAFLWWNRIIVLDKNVRGWHMGPSHLIGQDLENVWLAK